MIPGLDLLWNGMMIKNAWQLNPWSRRPSSGSSANPRETAFAGEHTESQNGFLNSASQSGLRAAHEVAESLA